jgi:hypothetical protein
MMYSPLHSHADARLFTEELYLLCPYLIPPSILLPSSQPCLPSRRRYRSVYFSVCYDRQTKKNLGAFTLRICTNPAWLKGNKYDSPSLTLAPITHVWSHLCHLTACVGKWLCTNTAKLIAFFCLQCRMHLGRFTKPMTA